MGNYDYRGWNFDNTYLIGEAAGLVDPIIGEGMYYACVTGDACGEYLLTGSDRKMKKIIKKLNVRKKLHEQIHTKGSFIQKFFFYLIDHDNVITRNILLKPLSKWLITDKIF